MAEKRKKGAVLSIIALAIGGICAYIAWLSGNRGDWIRFGFFVLLSNLAIQVFVGYTIYIVLKKNISQKYVNQMEIQKKRRRERNNLISIVGCTLLGVLCLFGACVTGHRGDWTRFGLYLFLASFAAQGVFTHIICRVFEKTFNANIPTRPDDSVDSQG